MRLLIVGLLVTFPLVAEKFLLKPTDTAPVATGEVDVNRDEYGDSKIDLTVDHLARAAELSPAHHVYVVWVQPSPGAAQNMGEMKVGDDLKGQFKAVTPLRNFDVFITAETDPQTPQPRGPVVMRAAVHQTGK